MLKELIMSVKDHFNKMLITIGWFGTGAIMVTASIFLYRLLASSI